MTSITPSSFPSAPARTIALAAVGAGGILMAFAGLQVALAAGAPLGEHVWGGSQARVLPTGMRIVAGGSAMVLTLAATVVARRAGLLSRPAAWLTPATWGIAAYLALNTVGNLASTSSIERFAFGSATATASALAAFVASHGGRGAPDH